LYFINFIRKTAESKNNTLLTSAISPAIKNLAYQGKRYRFDTSTVIRVGYMGIWVYTRVCGEGGEKKGS
jgi:hypothetical protein